LAAALAGQVWICAGDRVIDALADHGRGIGTADLTEELG
jgi:hypothetical protein